MQLRAARAVDVAISGQHVDNLQIVLHAHLKVGAVMSRGNLEGAGTEVDFHVVVGNNRNLGVAERADDRLTNQVGEARVLRVHGHSDVGHDGFGTSGGDEQLAAAVGKLVTDGVKLALGGGHDDFLIGKSGAEHGVPVHHAAATVDEAFLEQLGEGACHLRGKHIVHGESLALPVAGAAQLLKLLDDDAAVLFLPVPHHVHESLTAHIVAGAGRRFLGQFLFHAGLRGNACVVGTGQPEHFLAFLSGTAGKYILNCVVEYVTHVQHARHIGRGNDDAVSGLVRVGVSMEATL